MRKRIFCFGCCLLWILGLVGTAHAEKVQDHVRAESTIRSIVIKLKATDEFRPFLADVDPGKLSFSNQPMVDQGKGWIVRWTYEKDVGSVKRPNLSRGYAMEVKSDTGIYLKLYIASDEGGLLEDTTAYQTISVKPKLLIGAYLLTKQGDPSLKKRLKQIIADQAALLQKR